jgi:hypothetical protein
LENSAKFWTSLGSTQHGTLAKYSSSNIVDAWKTFFKTKFGLYEWMVIPFGLTNILETFLHLINDILKEHLGKIVVIYLDDILVFRKMCYDHLFHLHMVLELLSQHKFHVKRCKSSFGQYSISYFGFLFSAKGVDLDPLKFQSFSQWFDPTSTLELKSFMGGINFYRCFISIFFSFSPTVASTLSLDSL